VLVPRKQVLVKSSADTVSRESRASNFSIGSDSPVRLACMTNRSLEEITRRSAGIMSPAESFTTSPGTRSLRGTSVYCPSRTTVAVTVIIAFSRAAAESARDSWMNLRRTPRMTIRHITVPALGSSVANEIAARAVRRTTRGLRREIINRQSHPCRISWATSFNP
jgi:hypothetical protein